MAELKLMKARRALDPDGLRDPLGDEPRPAAPAPPRPRPRAQPRRRAATRPPAAEIGAGTDSPGTRRDVAPELLEGPRSAVAVMFEPDVWAHLSGLTSGLREDGVRLSVNALLVLTLAEGLPDGDAAALDLVGRRELELADRGPSPQRDEHTVRLPRALLARYTALGEATLARGFGGARSAVLNAVVAITGPKNAEEAAGLEQRARRARGAAVVRAGEPGAA